MTALPERWGALVPELACSDVERSVEFYTRFLGAKVVFVREGFACLAIGEAQLMLEHLRSAWTAGPLEQPFGRGVNFQIEVEDVAECARSLAKAGVQLFRPLMESWYQADETEIGQLECLIQDPDGYVLRLCTPLGERMRGVDA